MAVAQSYLDGLRSNAGFGMSYTRPAAVRSNDQNNTISGNQGYSSNMPIAYAQQQPSVSWQQMALNQQNQQAMLAQNPSNINFIQPQPAPQQGRMGGFGVQQQQQPSAWGGVQSQMAARAQGMTPLQYAMMQPGADQNAIRAALQAQAQNPQGGGLQGFGQMQQRPGMYTMPQQLSYNGGGNPVNALFGNVQPQQVATRSGMGYTPPQLVAGPSGYRFNRPMNQ